MTNAMHGLLAYTRIIKSFQYSNSTVCSAGWIISSGSKKFGREQLIAEHLSVDLKLHEGGFPPVPPFSKIGGFASQPTKCKYPLKTLN